MTQRDTAATIDWYRTHETSSQLGFNPDGMCLKICRTARNIGAAYPSALSAQQATPREHRVTDVSEIRRGMVVYYDDPNDSNPYGHIVTVVGRTKDRDPDDLGNLLVRTNSVQSGRVVVVRGDYFGRFWADPFQFAATWLNGVELDMPEPAKASKPKKTLPPQGRERLQGVLDELNAMIENYRRADNDRVVKALRRDKAEIRQTLDQFKGLPKR